MRAHVVLATKGRPGIVARLVDDLGTQTRRPATLVLVGASEADIGEAAARAAAWLAPDALAAVVAEGPGLCRQRNAGLNVLCGETGFVAFLDDDFRPARDWLEGVGAVFAGQDDVVGVTGRLLADGINTAPLSEADAAAYLSGLRPPGPSWASGSVQRDLTSAYGCNMAFRLEAALSCRFDERLPLYGWQEDRDFTGQMLRHGRVVYDPGPRGVHLGASAGRTGGLRMGYSQIANPVYLRAKGTMEPRFARRFLWRALAANMVRSARRHARVDYRGRLRGNALALLDAARGRLAPERILELDA